VTHATYMDIPELPMRPTRVGWASGPLPEDQLFWRDLDQSFRFFRGVFQLAAPNQLRARITAGIEESSVILDV
jgi:hypothetical protein